MSHKVKRDFGTFFGKKNYKKIVNKIEAKRVFRAEEKDKILVPGKTVGATTLAEKTDGLR